MKISHEEFINFAKSVLTDPSGISENSFNILSKIVKESNADEAQDFLSSVVDSSGRFYIHKELKGVSGEWYVYGSESTPIEDYEIRSRKDIPPMSPIFVNLDLSMVRVSPAHPHIKHSDDPNCGFGFLGSDPNKVVVVSKRKISKDEQLTIDKKNLPWLDLFNCIMGAAPKEVENNTEE